MDVKIKAIYSINPTGLIQIYSHECRLADDINVTSDHLEASKLSLAL